MNLLNLDKITLQDHEIKLNEKTYKIPGRISLGTMFSIIGNQQELEKSDNFDIGLFKQCVKSVYDVFIIRQPDLDFDEFVDSMDMEQYGNLVAYVTSLFGNTEEKKTVDQPEK
jgi:hypothetical protein